MKSEVELRNENVLLQKLYKSDTWKNIPSNVSSRITNQKPKLINYDNPIIQIITFTIKSNDPNLIYKTPVMYEYKGNFLPIIIKNERLENGYMHISFTDLFERDYFDFQVNQEWKIGNRHIEKDIPFDKIINKKNYPQSSQYVVSPTCMQQTTTYSDCLQCVINECMSDWKCAIGCGIESAGCLALWTIACAFHA